MTKAKTIAVPFESWFYLRTEMHNQRSESGRPLTEDWCKKHFAQNVDTRNGMILLKSGDMGGCKGNPKNGYDEGRWTSWTLEQMEAMLDAAGLPWSEGEEVEYFTI